MIDQADIALLAIVAAILLVSVLVTHVTLKRDSWKVQRYKLYGEVVLYTDDLRDDSIPLQVKIVQEPPQRIVVTLMTRERYDELKASGVPEVQG